MLFVEKKLGQKVNLKFFKISLLEWFTEIPKLANRISLWKKIKIVIV